MKKINLRQITELASRQLSATEIASSIGVTLSSVVSFCKRHDIQLKKRSRGGQNVKDMAGMTFGSLQVLHRDERLRGRLAWWACRCTCGRIASYRGSDLRGGKIKTCGCRTSVVSRRNWKGHGSIPKTYWSRLCHNASQRGILFSLSIEVINKLFEEQKKQCALSGLDIDFKNGTASLDRINNDEGYVLENVQWVHKDVNKMKQCFNSDYFVTLCQIISDWRKRRS